MRRGWLFPLFSQVSASGRHHGPAGELAAFRVERFLWKWLARVRGRPTVHFGCDMILRWTSRVGKGSPGQ